jgi:hypothetical protein
VPRRVHDPPHVDKPEAFYQGLKGKVGLAVAAKAAALRINLNSTNCNVVAPPMHALLLTPSLEEGGGPKKTSGWGRAIIIQALFPTLQRG